MLFIITCTYSFTVRQQTKGQKTKDLSFAMNSFVFLMRKQGQRDDVTFLSSHDESMTVYID
jgi:hypothetical protein